MNNQRENPTRTHNPQNNTTPAIRQSNSASGRYLRQTPTRRRRRRRKLNPRFVALMAVLLVMLIGIALCIQSCTKPTIKGRWDLDGTTVYEFGKNGKGALILMTAEYEFNYAIEGNTLSIDFVDDGALDAWYTFQVDNKVLFLTGGPGDAKSEYVLQKVN